MKVLITGGFGFIGGRLAEHLRRFGHNVLVGSRAIGGRKDLSSQSRVCIIDWTDDSALERACAQVDVVIHAAGMSAGDCIKNPVAALEFNGLGTARLVSSALKAKVQRFVYISTAHVYANPLVGVIDEHTCPRNIHPYASSHLAGENIVRSVNGTSEMMGIVLRLSNAFGSPVNRDVNCWTLLVNDLCRQAVQSHRISLSSNGVQQRDFVAMRDVCEITESLLVRKDILREGDIFNVGSGLSQSVLEMAMLIQSRAGAILDCNIELQKFSNEKMSLGDQLFYKVNALRNIGIVPSNNKIQEIDNLLEFCKANFVCEA